MRLFKSVFCFFLVFNCSAQQTDSSRQVYNKKVISFLASDEMKGRATGSEQEIIAANFIFEELKKNNGCKVVRQKFEFELDSIQYKSQNIIGFINNHSKNTILLSAHYDHLGFGGKLSNSKGANAVHNGADDNASGVALLLNLAKTLSSEDLESNFLFIAYSGHEIGLFGSEYFINHLNRKYKKIELVVNFDMVGRLNTEKVIYYDCTSDIDNKINEFSSESLNISKGAVDRINTLDTKWFVEKEIPSITFSTGRHIDYHKTTDDIEYINFEGLELIENTIIKLLQENYLTTESREM